MRKYDLKLDNGTRLTVHQPTVRMWYDGYRNARTDEAVYKAIADICSRNDEGIAVEPDYIKDNFTMDDFKRFASEFPKWIENELSTNPNS